jgi:Transcriptional regulatory protein, C terminal
VAAEAEFCLLGPLLVRRGGAVVPVTAGKQRVLLAALLLSANRVVSVDELDLALWGKAPPVSARVTVQNYVKRLRQALGGAGDSRISTLPDGYMITVAAGELDVSCRWPWPSPPPAPPSTPPGRWPPWPPSCATPRAGSTRSTPAAQPTMPHDGGSAQRSRIPRQ